VYEGSQTQRHIISQKPEPEVFPDIEPSKILTTANESRVIFSPEDFSRHKNSVKLELLVLERPLRKKESIKSSRELKLIERSRMLKTSISIDHFKMAKREKNSISSLSGHII